MSELLFPGDFICLENEFRSGKGTKIQQGKILSCVVGKKEFIVLKEENEIEVQVVGRLSHELDQNPNENSIVLCQITKLHKEKASALILFIEKTKCLSPIHSTIPIKNISQTETKITNCFRPGDIIVAKVIGQSSAILQEGYLLSVKEQTLGVIAARSAISGEYMKTLSENRMIDPISKTEERRKIALEQKHYLF